MINLVLELEGNNLSPVLQELSDYGGRNIVIPREISEQVIFRTVSDMLQHSRVNRSVSFLSATRNGETRFFQVREIRYLESSRNLLCICTVQGRYEVYGYQESWICTGPWLLFDFPDAHPGIQRQKCGNG